MYLRVHILNRFHHCFYIHRAACPLQLIFYLLPGLFLPSLYIPSLALESKKEILCHLRNGVVATLNLSLSVQLLLLIGKISFCIKVWACPEISNTRDFLQSLLQLLHSIHGENEPVVFQNVEHVRTLRDCGIAESNVSDDNDDSQGNISRNLDRRTVLKGRRR